MVFTPISAGKALRDHLSQREESCHPEKHLTRSIAVTFSEQIWGLEVGAPAALSSSQFTTRAADLPMGVSLSPHPSPHFFHHLPTITNQAR